MKLQNKNILLILHEGALGGAQRQALGLAKYLSQVQNCKVDLLLTFSRNTTKEFDDFLSQCGITNVIHVKNPYLFFNSDFSIKNLKRLKWSIEYLFRLRKELKPYNHEILIPFLNYTSKVSFYIYKLLPSVKFTFWHQLGLDILSNDYFEKYAAYNMPCVIGNATNCFEIFETKYILPKNKLNLLPQYITLTKEIKDKNELKKSYNIDSQKIVIGMIAHYRADKYQELLLEVFIDLLKKYKNIHLVFLGNKENDETSNQKYLKLIRIAKDNNIDEHVSVLSNVDVKDILNSIDIGVLLSMIEGTPNTVMEYMLYELPVIASNHPGCIGLLQDSPYLVTNDKEEVVSKISILIESEIERNKEGNNNKERIKAYDVETYVLNFEKIMNKYLKK